MKYLSEILESRQTEIFKKYDVFFAFSNKQLEEGRKDYKNEDLVHLGSGMICPKKYSKDVYRELTDLYEKGVAEDIEMHGIENVIIRELDNHECFYTHELEGCFEALSEYPGIDQQLIIKTFLKERSRRSFDEE